MLFSQRRQLHRAVAEWYERTYAEDLEPFYPLLAHHWGRAEEPTQAVVYLEKAGENALHMGAYQEAVRFLSDAVALETHGRHGLSRLILGSVADKVVRGAHAPVLVHRPAQP